MAGPLRVVAAVLAFAGLTVAAVLLSRPVETKSPPPPPKADVKKPAEEERVGTVIPPDAPAYLPKETEFQRAFLTFRSRYVADPRTVLQDGVARRYIIRKPEEALPLLKAAVESESNARFRAWSMLLLGDLKRPELAEELFLPRLKSDPLAAVRANAAVALGMLGDSGHAAALREAAATDADPLVRQAALEAAERLAKEEPR